MRRLLLLAGLAVMIGCGDDDDGGAAAGGPGLEGVAWAQESGPSATFADGTVSGSAGCNQYTAPYTVDGDQLEIGTAATTNMACAPPADRVEREFLAALDRVASWQVDGDELVLSDGDGKELLRFHEASLTGAWDATSFRQRDAVSSPLPGTEVTAVFGEDGTLAGSAGCNTYTAKYESDGAKITIGKPAATETACITPEGVMEQEQAYLAALPLAKGFRVEGERLSLLTAEDTYVAIYQRAP